MMGIDGETRQVDGRRVAGRITARRESEVGSDQGAAGVITHEDLHQWMADTTRGAVPQPDKQSIDRRPPLSSTLSSLSTNVVYYQDLPRLDLMVQFSPVI